MTACSSALLPVVAKLETLTSLERSDREALLGLPHAVRGFAAGDTLIREGEPPKHCSFMLSGWACRQLYLPDGSRQIVSLHLKGDPVGLDNALLEIGECGVQALSDGQVITVPTAAVRQLIDSHPGAARALRLDMLVDAATQRQWTVNVGRRGAHARLAHLLCELGIRIEDAGIGDRERYEIPMTQQELGDTTGLSVVHVNRVLQSLGAKGLIERDGRDLRIGDWAALRDAGGFDSHYLHPLRELQQSG